MTEVAKVPQAEIIGSSKLPERTLHPLSNLTAYYQSKLDEFMAKRIDQGDDFSALKELAKKRREKNAKIDKPKEEEKPQRIFTKTDRLRHSYLISQAMLSGVRNIKGFLGLVEYLETTETSENTVVKDFKKEPSEQEKNAVLKEWEAKGYTSTGEFMKDVGSKGKLRLAATKTVPFNVRTQDIPALKEMLLLNDNPLFIIQSLRKLGPLHFDIWNYAISSKFLHPLLSAPYAKEVLAALTQIPNISKYYDFFAYYQLPQSLVEVAQSPNFSRDFTPQIIERIIVLSEAMGKAIRFNELAQYQKLASNPLQFNFLCAALRDPYFRHPVNIFKELNNMEEAGLLGPLTLLAKNGVTISRYAFFQEIDIEDFKKELSYFIEDYVKNPQIQAFVSLYSEMTGDMITTQNIGKVLSIFPQKEAFVYLYDLVLNEREKETWKTNSFLKRDSFSSYLEPVLRDDTLRETLTSQEFASFLSELQADGYKTRALDFQDFLPRLFKLKDFISTFGFKTSDFLKYREEIGFIESLIKDARLMQMLKTISEEGLLSDQQTSFDERINQLKLMPHMPLLEQPILDKIPLGHRRTWLKCFNFSYGVSVIFLNHIRQSQEISRDVIEKVSILTEQFKSVDAATTVSYSRDIIKQFLTQAEFAGRLSEFIKDGELTHQTVNYFLKRKDITVLSDLLTEKALNAYPENERAALRVWKDLPWDVKNTVLRKTDFPNISESELLKFKGIAEVIDIIKKSPSKEIQRLQQELIALLWETEDPKEYAHQILNVFERNNLPLVGKIFRVFEILHPPQVFENKLQSRHDLSPVLTKADTIQRYSIIFRDLIKISADSGNPSLYNFLKTLQEGQGIITDIERNGIAVLEGPQNLGRREAAVRFLNRLDTLYANSNYRGKDVKRVVQTEDIQERIAELRRSLGIKGNQSLLERVSAIFLRPLGYSSLDQLIARIDAIKREAHERNMQFANEAIRDNSGIINLKAGDLLKGIQIQYLENILSNGSLAKEYLGASASSDSTPFDTDVSLILGSDIYSGIENAIGRSIAQNYGDLLLVVRNRGQFQSSIPNNPQYDKDRYELFGTGVAGERHFGIRTGFASTQIDAMVVKGNLASNEAELQRVFFSIAQNDVYIPVVDIKGNILFTPELFETYKVKDKLIREILQKRDFNPQELLSALKVSPFIKNLYEGPAGVWEGYTLEEHTRMAMGQYEKYFSGRWQSFLVSQEGFRFMLALHDFGKPLAVQITHNKGNQHEYTIKFLPRILEGAGFGPRETEILVAIAKQDNLGKYLQGKLDIQSAGRNIKALADETGLPVNQLFELIKMYFICDAGAYTQDASGKPSLDELFEFSATEEGKGQARFSKDTQQKVDELEETLTIAAPLKARITKLPKGIVSNQREAA